MMDLAAMILADPNIAPAFKRAFESPASAPSSAEMIDGRRVVVEHVFPPIPVRCCDWRATLDGYDEGDSMGYGPTREAAIADLRDQVES